MTLDEIRGLDREFLIPREIAPLLGCDPQDIRVAARMAPERLGFPVCVVGTRVKVPKIGFLNWWEWKMEGSA